MKLRIEKPVVVITPTIGLDSLTQAMTSVANQTYKNIKHLIVIDGPEYFEKTLGRVALSNDDPKFSLAQLSENTGQGQFYGHRIYASFPHLVNEDYVAFLDEDNWWEPNHVESLVNKIEENDLDWAHSLRNVYLHEKDGGEFLDQDCCEAIGRWQIPWFDQPQFLVDTSSYLFKREILIRCCALWHWGWGGDRRFFMMIKDQTKYDTSGEHTLNYRLPQMDKAYGGQKDIFKIYNAKIKEQYGDYPWKLKTLSSGVSATTNQKTLNPGSTQSNIPVLKVT